MEQETKIGFSFGRELLGFRWVYPRKPAVFWGYVPGCRNSDYKQGTQHSAGHAIFS